MEYVYQTIELNLGETEASMEVRAKRGDTATKLSILLFNGGYPYIISPGCYAVLTAAKPDGSILYNHCDIEDNAIIYTFTEQTTSSVGRMRCEVKLYGPKDQLINCSVFRIIVEGTLYSDALVESKDEVSALTHLVSQAATVIADGKDTNSQGKEILEEAEQLFAQTGAARDAANQAAADAQAAATGANTAADAVHSASQRIESAAMDAAGAVNNANSAVSRAQEVLDLAEEAAQTAFQMASDAQQAVKDAKSAVDEADKAVMAANTAADRANAASDIAYEANQKVDTLREVVSKFHSNIVEDASGELVTLSDASDLELAGLKVFGKTTQNGTPTPESPVALESVGSGGSVGITVAGKNLLDSTQLQPSTIMKYYQMKLKPNGVYTLSTNLPKTYNDDDSAYLFIISGTDTSGLSTNGHGAWDGQNRTVIPDGDGFVTVCYRVDNTNVSSFDGYQIQLEYGSTATAYEAYKENQSLPMITFAETALSSGNPLAGIPVTSGGNYTDENGQQWIANYRDWDRGVDVQNIGKLVYSESTGSINGMTTTNTAGKNRFILSKDAAITPNAAVGPVLSNIIPTVTANKTYLCNNGICVNSNGEVILYLDTLGAMTSENALVWLKEKNVEILYGLATPIETPIPEDELAVYQALHTNYPNTTVCNDAGAHMQLQYVADTKLYVDKKFAELAQALVSST